MEENTIEKIERLQNSRKLYCWITFALVIAIFWLLLIMMVSDNDFEKIFIVIVILLDTRSLINSLFSIRNLKEQINSLKETSNEEN